MQVFYTFGYGSDIISVQKHKYMVYSTDPFLPLTWISFTCIYAITENDQNIFLFTMILREFMIPSARYSL